MEFQKTLAIWRKKHRLTQQQAAAHLSVAYRTLQQWLSGKNGPHPDRRTVILKRMEDFDNASAPK